MSRRLSAEERQALSELNRILSETPQWSSEEELRHDVENIGGRVRFCHFWDEHYSMVQLTEDCNGKYSTAYVLDAETTPDVRKAAALQAQKELADCMQAVSYTHLDVYKRQGLNFMKELNIMEATVLTSPNPLTLICSKKEDGSTNLAPICFCLLYTSALCSSAS